MLFQGVAQIKQRNAWPAKAIIIWNKYWSTLFIWVASGIVIVSSFFYFSSILFSVRVYFSFIIFIANAMQVINFQQLRQTQTFITSSRTRTSGRKSESWYSTHYKGGTPYHTLSKIWKMTRSKHNEHDLSRYLTFHVCRFSPTISEIISNERELVILNRQAWTVSSNEEIPSAKPFCPQDEFGKRISKEMCNFTVYSFL